MSPKIQELTGITQEYLDEEGMPFTEAWIRFQKWIQDRNNNGNKNSVVLVAHNGRNFDYNFIDAELNRSNFAPLNQHVTCLLDSLDILRDKTLWDVDKPSSFSLGNLYRYIRAKELDNAHNAMFDVLALAEILESQRLKDKWRKVANNKQFLI